MKKVLFISSTGGHLRELMLLKDLFKNYNYHIVTEKDITTNYLKEVYKNKVDYLPYGTRSKPFSYVFKFLFLVLKSVYLFFKIEPEIIITTGTHTAVPMCYLGKIFYRKIIYIETFANISKKTLSGKLVYPIADLFIVHWKEMIKMYPKAICVEKTLDI